jgi:type II secretory pathway pseudopilin PulG
MTGTQVLMAMAAVVAIVFVIALKTARRGGKAQARAEAAESTLKAVQRGSAGATEAQNAIRDGKTPQDIKAANDKAWK